MQAIHQSGVSAGLAASQLCSLYDELKAIEVCDMVH
jgi:hypothetical protein